MTLVLILQNGRTKAGPGINWKKNIGFARSETGPFLENRPQTQKLLIVEQKDATPLHMKLKITLFRA